MRQCPMLQAFRSHMPPQAMFRPHIPPPSTPPSQHTHSLVARAHQSCSAWHCCYRRWQHTSAWLTRTRQPAAAAALGLPRRPGPRHAGSSAPQQAVGVSMMMRMMMPLPGCAVVARRNVACCCCRWHCVLVMMPLHGVCWLQSRLRGRYWAHDFQLGWRPRCGGWCVHA